MSTMAADGGVKDATEQALDTSDNSLRAGEEPSVAMEVNGGALVVDHRVDAAANNDNDGACETAASNNINDEDRALAVPVVRTLSPIELLIPVIMTYLLEFVDLPTRIKVASASTTLSRLIYQQCSALWVKIELSPRTLSHKMRLSITEDTLAALLLRVNALNTTKILILHRCFFLRDTCTGLEPLRRSPVLERACIWPRDWNHLCITTFTDILRTMLPHNLTEVEFPFSMRNDEEMTIRDEFLLELRQTVHQRAIDRSTECIACHHPVREVSRQIVPGHYGLPSTRCYTCQKHFCRTIACPMEFRDCSYCGNASCGECKKVERCGGCHDTICTDCTTFSEDCVYCKQKFCSDHWDCDGFASTCGLCNKTVCNGCSEKHADNSIYYCSGCNDDHCSDCRERFTCSHCNDVFCSQKHERARCSVCMRATCSECILSAYIYDECSFVCNKCGLVTCSDCVQQDEEGAWLLCPVCDKGSWGDSDLEDCDMPQYKKTKTESDDGGGGSSAA